MDKKYIGDKEIVGIKKNIVTFVDDIQKEYTKKQLTYLVTDEPTDLTQLRNLMLKNILPEVFKLIEDHNVKYGDLDALLQHIDGGYKEGLYKAVGQAIGTYEEGVHTSYFMENIDAMKIKAQNKGNFTF